MSQDVLITSIWNEIRLIRICENMLKRNPRSIIKVLKLLKQNKVNLRGGVAASAAASQPVTPAAPAATQPDTQSPPPTAPATQLEQEEETRAEEATGKEETKEEEGIGKKAIRGVATVW